MANQKSQSPPDGAASPEANRVKDRLFSSESDTLAHWILIRGDRWVIAAITLFLVVCGFVVFGIVWTDEFVGLFTETEVVQALLITLLSGIILLVSIAVSVNAVVLSQETPHSATRRSKSRRRSTSAIRYARTPTRT